MPNLLVRVVILNFNQPHYTIKCIESIREQNYSDIDIVIVDNGSKSNNIQLLENGITEDIILIKTEKNIGYAAGNNIGCKSIQILNEPDFYFILNNDTVLVDSNCISNMILSLTKDQYAAAISPLINTISTSIDVRNQIQVRKILSKNKLFISNGSLLRRTPIGKKIFNSFIYKSYQPFEKKNYIVDTINGAAFIIKGDIFRKIGLFDEGTFLYNEELILGNQIKNLGMHCLLSGFSEIIHYQGISTKQSGKILKWEMTSFKIDSELYLYKKYYFASRYYLNFVRMFRIMEYFIKSFLNKFDRKQSE